MDPAPHYNTQAGPGGPAHRPLAEWERERRKPLPTRLTVSSLGAKQELWKTFWFLGWLKARFEYLSYQPSWPFLNSDTFKRSIRFCIRK